MTSLFKISYFLKMSNNQDNNQLDPHEDPNTVHDLLHPEGASKPQETKL